MQHFLVIDVESVGLTGQAFVVAGVVVDNTGQEHELFLHSCNCFTAKGTPENRRWVLDNVEPTLPEPDLKLPKEVCSAFCDWWKSLKAKYPGIILAADCCWPVETNFLNECHLLGALTDELMPYPFLDINGVLLAAGLDPIGTYYRLELHEPAHNPLNDARHSARLLIWCLKYILSREAERVALSLEKSRFVPVVHAARQYAETAQRILHYEEYLPEDGLALVSAVARAFRSTPEDNSIASPESEMPHSETEPTPL